jgi:hypothetical protein
MGTAKHAGLVSVCMGNSCTIHVTMRIFAIHWPPFCSYKAGWHNTMHYFLNKENIKWQIFLR